MAGGTHIPIFACHEGGRLILRPSGACTVSVCGGLKGYLSGCKKPEITDVYFDLSDAAGLDSTFIGLLLAMATRNSDPAAPALHLVAPSAQATEALQRMYVMPLFHVQPTPPETCSTWVSLALEKAGPAQTADVVVQAHESLIEADLRNAPSCQPVVEGFRLEKNQKRTKEP